MAAKILFTFGTGEKGCDVDENNATMMNKPKGIFVDPKTKDLLVADANNNRCLRFPPNSRTAKQFAGDARQIPEYDDIGRRMIRDDHLDRPYALCTDPKGERLFVSDAHNCRILSFDPEKNEKTQKGEQLLPPVGMRQSNGAPEAVKYPRCLFFMDPEDQAEQRKQNSERLVVVDTWSHRVLLVEPGSTTEKPKLLAGSANSFGTRTDQLSFPSWACFLPKGSQEALKDIVSSSSADDEPKTEELEAENSQEQPLFSRPLIVSDSSNHRLMRYLPGDKCGRVMLGNFMCNPGAGAEELDTPTGLAVCPKTGALLVCDRNNHRLLRIKNPAEALPKTAAPEVLLGPEELKHPWAVCFDADGFCYVSDEGHHRVLKLDLENISQ